MGAAEALSALAVALEEGLATSESPSTFVLPSGDSPVKLDGRGVDAGAAGAAAPLPLPLDVDEPLDEPLDELDEPEPDEELVLVPRASAPIISGEVSTKMTPGPATCWVVARSTTLLMSGLASLVIQSATGPLMPGGTTHCERGKLMEKGAPPTIMLQKRPWKEIERDGYGFGSETYVRASDVGSRHCEEGPGGDWARVGDGEGVRGCGTVIFSVRKRKKTL